MGLTMSYSSRSDIEDVFGIHNVEVWADLDGDEDSVKIASRIARAIVVADEEINDALRGGPYEVPVTRKLDGTAGVPTTLTDVSAKLAGAWVYENRRLEDTDQEAADGRVSAHGKRAREILADITSGKRRIDAYRQDDEITAPFVNEVTLSRDE